MKLFAAIFLLLLTFGSTVTNDVSAQVNKYRFEQLDSLQEAEKRNIVVFIYTDWCKYCQAMKNTTFKDDSVVALLNEKFYFFELNGEEKNSITFNKHTFNFKPTGTSTGVHELAEQLGTLENEISYPAICILNGENEIVGQYNGFLNAAEMLKVLRDKLMSHN